MKQVRPRKIITVEFKFIRGLPIWKFSLNDNAGVGTGI
jgi:hypothetical protein